MVSHPGSRGEELADHFYFVAHFSVEKDLFTLGEASQLVNNFSDGRLTAAHQAPVEFGDEPKAGSQSFSVSASYRSRGLFEIRSDI